MTAVVFSLCCLHAALIRRLPLISPRKPKLCQLRFISLYPFILCEKFGCLVPNWNVGSTGREINSPTRSNHVPCEIKLSPKPPNPRVSVHVGLFAEASTETWFLSLPDFSYQKTLKGTAPCHTLSPGRDKSFRGEK